MEIENISKNTDVEELAKAVQATPMKQLVFPVKLCDNLNREIYLPYRYFSELIIIEEFDDLPITIQWLYVELAFGIRVLGNKKPEYKKLYEVQSEILRRVQYNQENARVTLMGVSINKKHLFRALELVNRAPQPITIGAELVYPIIGFSTAYKQDFLYSILTACFDRTFLNKLKRTKTQLYLSTGGVIYLDKKLVETYPEIQTRLDELTVLEDGGYEFVHKKDQTLAFKILEV